mmetsp:Transcript_56504/g.127236  ORF Transcript_56504/g.127236 Transcript_56504/m.127236 type:complete len:94 (+) Transcript_56504:2-283(+)
MLMYFLFKQAYIMPMEAKLCFLSSCIVAVEGLCGVVNVLQTVTAKPVRASYVVTVVSLCLCFIFTVGALIFCHFMPMQEEEELHLPHSHAHAR